MPYTAVTHPDLDARARLAEASSTAGRRAIAVAPRDVRAVLGDCDVLVCGAESGLAAVSTWERVRAEAGDVACVVVTPDRSPEAALRALRAGVADYVAGPAPGPEVATAVTRAAGEVRLRRTLRMLAARGDAPDGPIVGESAGIRRVREMVARIAHNDATVLIAGETGTGKEVVARTVHARSARRCRAFVAVNCAALPAPLVESELFGHERGAFTGALRARRGLFVEAHGGTLFLDEIAEMPATAQSKLLRVLADRTVRPVGGDSETPVDVRVIAATGRDLEAEVRAGRFRDDLRYRLDVVRIELPPLRERPEDVLLLANMFLRRHAAAAGKDVTSLSRGAARRLCRYGWPGNVRELETCMERAVVFARRRLVTEQDLPDRVGPKYRRAAERFRTEERVPLEVVECAHLARVMRDVNGNKSRAAEILGLDRKTLYRKLRAHALVDVADEADEPTLTVTIPEGLRD